MRRDDGELLLPKESSMLEKMTNSLYSICFGPKESLPDSLDSEQRVVVVGNQQRFSFRSNFVKTSKYEIYNFLPKFLLEEFNPATKVANCYFLAIASLQCIRQISNTNGVPTTLIPLFFVVLVDGFFHILEDISRHRADREANSSISRKYDKSIGQFVQTMWSEISVGDLIMVQSREPIPCDMILVGVSEKEGMPPQGAAYVETKSLDGETNLKMRNALPSTYKLVMPHYVFYLYPDP